MGLYDSGIDQDQLDVMQACYFEICLQRSRFSKDIGEKALFLLCALVKNFGSRKEIAPRKFY